MTKFGLFGMDDIMRSRMRFSENCGVYCVGVWIGAQGSQSVRCVLPGPLGSIVTGVLRISVSSSSSRSEADGSPGGSSAVSSSKTSSS